MLKMLALDRFTILLFVMVILATFLPVSGQAAEIFGYITTAAIAILFFLHGAKLSRTHSLHFRAAPPSLGVSLYEDGTKNCEVI